MKLLIVESPNKIKKIQGFLGSEWTVATTVGHFRDLPRKTLGVDLNNFNLTYEFIPETTYKDKEGNKRISSGGQERANKIAKLAKNAESIFLATDPDREGEAIAWHLHEVLKPTNYQRVTFTEITEKAVKTAITQGRLIDNNLVQAQEARRALDRVVGYLVSNKLSENAGTQLTAGRVQSPAVRLIVDREQAISSFKKTKHYGARVLFGKMPKGWTAEWDTKPFINDENPYILNIELANEAISHLTFTVLDVEEKLQKVASPCPFSTSLLLQASSVALKLNAEQTAKWAQRLFEQGHITYIRTDSVNLSDEANIEIINYLHQQNWSVASQTRKFKSKSGAQEAHEAIRPTHIEQDVISIIPAEQELYNLIRLRTLASQMADAVYKVRKVKLQTTTSDGRSFEFIATGRVLIEKGWKALTQEDSTTDEEEVDLTLNNPIPELIKGAVIEASKGEVLNKETAPPPRYSLASLIKTLENKGIGRPATYPTIIKNITERGYITTNKDKFTPTDLGYQLIHSLIDSHFSFINLSYTASLEDLLDKIAEGKADYYQVVSQHYEQLASELTQLNNIKIDVKIENPCPNCQGALKRLKRKEAKGFFWVCRNTDCKTFLDDNKGKPLLGISPCPKCKEDMQVHLSTKGNKWWKCTNADCAHTMGADKKGNPVEFNSTK